MYNEQIKWVAVAIAVSQNSSFTIIASSHQLTIIDQDALEFLILSELKNKTKNVTYFILIKRLNDFFEVPREIS